MRPIFVILIALSALVAFSQSLPGDSRRGAAVLRDLRCIECHRIGGEGGTAGPDLSKAMAREYMPSSMAAKMWNHAPAMWKALEQKGIQPPAMTDAQSADMYAYFHAVRFFDRAGDAAAGRRVFTARKCGECHGITQPVAGSSGAPPVVQWGSLNSSIAFAQRMWNHAVAMEEAMKGKNMLWSPVNSKELIDLLVYVQNLPQTRNKPREFTLSVRRDGASLFREKGCAGCHQGAMALENRPLAGTVTDFAVSMWNHAPRMAALSRKEGKPLPQLQEDEMRDIIAYLWNQQLYAERGNAARGANQFTKKNCATCHTGNAGPDLKAWAVQHKTGLGVSMMTAALWQHGPAMLAQMEAKKIPWPQFNKQEMLDLMAYLNTMSR